MEIKFDVYFKKNLGTLFKNNEVDLNGLHAHTNLQLALVDRLEINYEVDGVKYTDDVVITDATENLIQIPFKSDVMKAGQSEFEIVAYMKNGDIKTSQTYTYNIDEAIGEGKQTGSGGSSDGHTHSNLNVLNSITQSKISEWNNKADSTHSHSEYASKNHNHNEYANITHTHSEYLKELPTHEHEQYLTEHQDISHKADRSEIPTKTSQLTNDSDYATNASVDEKIASASIGGTTIFRDVNEGEIFTLGDSQGGGTTPSIKYGKIVTSVDGLEVLEGDSCTFTIKLDSAPTQEQVVTIISDVVTVVPSPSSVTFTTSNYNAPVTVTLDTSADEDSNLTYCNITLSTNSGNKVLILQVKEPENSGGTEEPETPATGMITEGLVHKYDYTNLTSDILEDTVGNDDLTINENYKLGESYGPSLGYVQSNTTSALFTQTSFAESLTSYTILMRVSPSSISGSTTILNAGAGSNAGNTQLVDWGSAALGMYCAGTSIRTSANQFAYGENQIIIGIAVDGEALTESIILNGSIVVTGTGSQTYPCTSAQPFGYLPPRNKFKYYECMVYNRVLSESELTSICEYMLANK